MSEERQEYDLTPEDVPALKLPAGTAPTDITMQRLPDDEPMAQLAQQMMGVMRQIEERTDDAIRARDAGDAPAVFGGLDVFIGQPREVQMIAGIDLDTIAGRLRSITTEKLRYAGRGSIDVLLRTEQDGTEIWARYLEVFGPNVAGCYKDPAPLDAESDFFMHAREDMAVLLDEVRRLLQVRAGALAEIQLLNGAMRANDWRLQNAGQRVGIIAGCDTPDQMAEEILKLRAGIERIGAERDQMEAANKQQADEISRLNAIIAGMASLPATSEPR